MVYKNKTKLLLHTIFSCLNISSVFSWRKPDVFRLWEGKFSWYLFPQQSWAAFGTQVPVVKLLILQSPEAAEAMLSDWLEKVRWCGFEGAAAATGSSPSATPSIHNMMNYFEDNSSRILLQLTASSLPVNSLWNKLRYHRLHHLMLQKMALQSDRVSSW